MININLQLYSILREKLPADAKGRAVFQLDEGATLAEVLNMLGIKRKVTISVNDVQETNRRTQLNDGDEVKIFSSISGG